MSTAAKQVGANVLMLERCFTEHNNIETSHDFYLMTVHSVSAFPTCTYETQSAPLSK